MKKIFSGSLLGPPWVCGPPCMAGSAGAVVTPLTMSCEKTAGSIEMAHLACGLAWAQGTMYYSTQNKTQTEHNTYVANQ